MMMACFLNDDFERCFPKLMICYFSGGKTLVGELLLLNAVLIRDVDAMLILPYVALVDEKVNK